MRSPLSLTSSVKVICAEYSLGIHSNAMTVMMADSMSDLRTADKAKLLYSDILHPKQKRTHGKAQEEEDGKGDDLGYVGVP